MSIEFKAAQPELAAEYIRLRGQASHDEVTKAVLMAQLNLYVKAHHRHQYAFEEVPSEVFPNELVQTALAFANRLE
jgi:hypothetical protein